MKTVVIVTRTKEYNGYSDFQKAIEKMDECPFNLKKGLKEWIPKPAWESKKGEKNGDIRNALVSLGLESFLDQYNYLALKSGPSSADVFIIDKLKEKCGSPYASVNSNIPDIQIILVFPENLLINTEQAIPELVEFLKKVGEDCNIDGEDNILYIHDRQIKGEEIDDATVYNKEKRINLLDEFEYNSLKGIEDTYCYIAVFKHLPYSTSYFHSHILSMKFGQLDLLDHLIEFEQGIDKDDDISEIIKNINEITGNQ